MTSDLVSVRYLGFTVRSGAVPASGNLRLPLSGPASSASARFRGVELCQPAAR
ncbi:hypothetical protein [Amycolatopsis sp. cmx-4-54]|uniref:hypothetical protein n=1 Tax=Amycolatopsis sp. cmx-4-54 TaxID=2790936 RepID=UPI00397B0C99